MALRKKEAGTDACTPGPPNNFLVIFGFALFEDSLLRYYSHKLLNTSAEVE
jgi:hypothetical protein